MLRCLSCLLLTVTLAHGQTEGLIYYADFDHGPTTRAGSGWAVDLPTRASAFVPGRFGQGYRMERGRTNFLSPSQATVEADTSGFVAGEKAALRSVTQKTAFGRRVLQAETHELGPVWRTTPVQTAVRGDHKPVKTFTFSVYLRAAKPTTVRLHLRDTSTAEAWGKQVESDNRAALAKDPQAKVKPVLPPASTPAEAIIGPAWQRVAVMLEVDSRQPEQALVGSLELVAGVPATIWADGLQLEQSAAYPLSNTDPTTWLPGGTTVGPSWLQVEAADLGFDGRRGTLGCWVRPLPNQAGGSRAVNAVLTMGNGWFAPVWQIGGGMWYAGHGNPTGYKQGRLYGGNAEKALFTPSAHGGWHFLALAWDEKEASAYLDGKPFDKIPCPAGKLGLGTALRLGGSYLEHVAMTGDLDEVFLFRQRLTDTEVAALANREKPLSAQLPALMLRQPLRLTFLRSEAEATIPLEPTAPAVVSASIPALKAQLTGPAAPGKPLRLKLRPWLAGPGTYPLRVTLKPAQNAAPNQSVAVTNTLDIFEAPQGREFIIYAWGGLDPDLRERGFNSAVCGGRGAYRLLLERGMWANSRLDVRDAVPHPWSAATRTKGQPAAEAVAREVLASPNVVSCLVNSEVGDPPYPVQPDGALQPWFVHWMKQETQLTAIPEGVARDPMHVTPDPQRIPPPVVPEDYPPLRFLNWWGERGQGYWLLNNQLVAWMKAAGLRDVFYYSDQPEAVTQFGAMDMVDYWGYPKVPEGLVARFNHAGNYARLLGKRFQAMPGTIYWDDGNGLWVQDDDGKRKVLGLSPDCLRENLWLSVAAYSHSIGLYGIGERHTEVYDPACDQVMTDTYALLQPLGTLVGGLPEEAAPVAMLESEGLNFIQPGVGDDWVRHWLTRNVSRVLARSRLRFDWITDDHVAAGWLKRYKTVVLPGAWVLPQKTHRALVAFARAGGRVVADQALRAEIPGVQRLDIPHQGGPQDVLVREWGAWAQQQRAAHPGFVRVEPADQVFTFVRETPDRAARYLFLVNDHREPGPQQERFKITQMPADGGGPLRDRGLPTDVTVTLPAGLHLYDVLAHRPLTAAVSGGEQALRLRLEPGAARVIAVLPVRISQLQATLPAAAEAGTEVPLDLKVLDAAGKRVRGRQLVAVEVTSPAGDWAGVQRYQRLVDGRLTVPLRLPLTATRGAWQVTVTDWISGQRATRTVAVR